MGVEERMRAGNRTRLHFPPLLRKKTEVRLRQAVAGGARPRRVYIIRVLFLPNNKGRQLPPFVICERLPKRSRIEVRKTKSTPFTATQSLALNARLRFGLLETQTLMSRRKRTHQADL